MLIRIDQTDIERIKADMRHINNGMPTVVVRSINRAVDGVKTDMVTIARRVYTVKASAARKNISVRKAKANDMTAWTESVGRPIGLINFKVTPSTVQPRRKAPITVEVIKGEPKPVAHAFVSVMPTSHKGVFIRKKGQFVKVGRKWKKIGDEGRAGRLPVEERTGPRIEDLYARPEVQVELQAGADKRLSTELERQTDYLFKQRNGLL